jgi:ATP synthase, delta/epsilon subunit, beta-sandwich domain protein
MKNSHTMLLEIKTDKKIIYSGDVLSLTIKDAKGQECFMPLHCDTTKTIRDGIICISEPPTQRADSVSSSGLNFDATNPAPSTGTKGMQKKHFKASNAYLNISKNTVVIFAPDALEINV